MIARLANRAWKLANGGRERRFRKAVVDPEPVQRALLVDLVRANAGSEFGRRHGFSDIDSVRRFRQQVPITTAEDYAPLVHRIRMGEPDVLTSEPVLRLVPTSGSTAAPKLVPWTRSLHAEFENALGPWIVDLFRRVPAAAAGPAYWSLTPVVKLCEAEPAAVPVGCDDDTAYLGSWSRRLARAVLAVPPEVACLDRVDDLRYLTLLNLLAVGDLALVSVWHPSFVTLLMEALPGFWDDLLHDLGRGTCSLPSGRTAPRAGVPGARPARARRLAVLDPAEPGALWPRLAVISCWGDGHAARPAAALPRRFAGSPGLVLQPKGLLATEAVVSLPYAGRHPVAVCSHFVELLDDDDRSWLVHEVEQGREYSVVVTTGGGLYRYRLGDRVAVDGWVGRTPSLRFLCREANVVDLCGEKLHERHVVSVLERLLPGQSSAAFAMLAPHRRQRDTGYTLYVQAGDRLPAELAQRLDELLAENPHYRYCRRLGQLAAARVVEVAGAAEHAFLERHRQAGMQLGAVKPASLSPLDGWDEWFDRAAGPESRL